MKTKLKILPILIILCGTFATTAVFGQVIHTWTNSAAIDIGAAANWNPNGQPSGSTQDTAQWDGVVPGNLSLQYITGWPNTGFGTLGVNLVLTANQIGNVTIAAPAAGSPAVGIFAISNNSPSAVFRIGDNTSHLLNFATRPGNAGTVHNFVNYSTNAAIMDSSLAWVAGGGVACVMDFGGTGDWIVNHNLRQNNSGAGPVTVVLDGPGSMTWSNGGTWLASDALGPITNNGGLMTLKSAGLCPTFSSGVPAGNNTIILSNAAVLKYDATVSDNISRVISGTGVLQVNNGTLTLSGANTYTGNTLLSGGELIVNGTETAGTSGPLGVGGTISFTGGTLGFSVNNVFDYSSRCSTAPGQAYSFDTAGQAVTLASGLTSSGGTLTKVGSGTLTLSGANSYTGNTTVSAGKLVFQGTKSGSGNITVADSTALGVTAGGTQITPATFTLGTSSGATLEFDNVNSTTTAPIAAGTLSSAGALTININSGALTPGQSYPLLTWTSGSAPSVSLGVLNGFIGNLSFSGNKLSLNITATAYKWSGANNGTWDITTANNWVQNGGPAIFANGGPVLFDDSASGSTSVTVSGVVLPASVSVNNSTKTYSLASSSGNDIGGTASLSKSGSGTLTLSGGANAYTGATKVSGGTLIVGTLANGGSPSDIGAASSSAANLVLDGGTLQYTGGAASIDRLFTLTTAGGTIDDSGSGALVFSNTGALSYNGNGPRTLTLTGADTDPNTLAATLANNGGATSLAKGGAGLWILTGANTYSGGTTIAGGTLQIGAGGATGSPGTGNIVNNGALDFNRTGSLTVGTISGSGSVTNDGTGTIILPGNNTYQGGTTINAGTLQIGSGGATGQVDASSPIANNGTLIFNSTSDSTISGVISGTGQLIKRGSGLLKFIGNNTYTGGTTVDAGAQLQLTQGNTGANASPAITNNGTVIMMRQDNGIFIYSGNISGTGKVVENVSNGNGGDSTLTGTNTYTGGTYILGGGIVLGDSVTPGAGSIVGNVFLTNNYAQATFGPYVAATLTFRRPDDFIFAGNIVGDGSIAQQGYGTLILTGANTYTNGTTIGAGTLQVGAGGTNGTLGSGPITDSTTLVFNRSDKVTFNNVISGGGSIIQQGSGTVTLSATNTYAATTTVSNGTLIINGDNLAAATFVFGGTLGGTGAFYGPVSLEAGTTLAPGASAGSVGTLTINSDLTMAGNLAIDVNKSLSPSSDLVVVSGALTNTGTGTVMVANLGPALAVGDKFTLLSQPLLNGAALTVAGSGANWTNNLAVDGSISVRSFVARPTLNFTKNGNSLQFSWSGSFKLQAQTNSLSVGLRTNWADYPGGGTSPVTAPVDVAKGTVFFRLVPTP
jgi:autotransporter-associated beta strand protein